MGKEGICESLIKNMHEGFVLNEIIKDSNDHPINYRIIEINASFTNLTGIEADRIIGRKITDVFNDTENSQPSWIERFTYVVQSGKKISFEHYIEEINERFLVHAFPAENLIAATFSTIPESRSIEIELRQSEQKFRAIVEQSLTGIYIFSRNKFLYVNRRFCEIFGYTEEEILTQLKPTDVVQREEYERASENIDKRLKGEVDSIHYIAKGKMKDGSLIWIEIHGSHLKLNNRDVITGTVLDITERFETQIIIKENENKFRAAFEQSPFGMCITSLEGNILKVNETLCSILGYSEKELEGIHFNEITHPEDKNIGKDFMNNILGEDLKKGSFQKRYLHKDGRTIWVNIGSSLVMDFKNEPIHFITHIEDITEKKNAEIELRESEHRFRTLFDQAALGVAIINTKTGHYLRVNKKQCEIIGYDRDELLSTDFMDITYPDDLEKDLQHMEKLRQEKIPAFTIEKRYIHKNGSIVDVILHVFPLWRPGEEQELHVAICEDITARKASEQKLEESELRYRSLFENMNAGFVLFEVIQDPQGKPIDLRIVAANKGFEITTGLNLKDAQGEQLTRVLPGIEEDEADWIGTYSEIALTGNPRHFEQHSELLDTHYSISAFRAGPKLCAVTFTNISDRKRAENEIRKLNENLENEVKQRTLELEMANKELEAFTYSVSHDLRAPLRAIDGFSKFLLEDSKGKLGKEGNRYLETIRINTTKMDQLISALLRLSHVNIKQVSLLHVEMGDIVNQAIQESVSVEDQKKFQLQIKQLPRVWCDEKLLRQVWINLIANAVKYSAYSEKKKIVINYTEEEHYFVFYIRDSGIGFNPLYKNKLFGIFERLHSVTEFEGSGVGLAIVKRIVERHLGQVWAESELDKGATFYFSLPKATPGT